jgi:nucleoside-diphosphate-sugar epimerase
LNKTILVCGAGGFIGTHLANDLKSKGHNVIGVDIKHPLYEDTQCDEFYKQDLRDPSMVDFIFT